MAYDIGSSQADDWKQAVLRVPTRVVSNSLTVEAALVALASVRQAQDSDPRELGPQRLHIDEMAGAHEKTKANPGMPER